MDTRLNEIHVLFEGYSRSDPRESNAMRANCTCTLIKMQNGQNVVVDTMTAWDGQRLIDALKIHDMEPNSIDFVICTHGHADHIGCNYLFPDAKWHIVGTCISKYDKFLDWNFDENPFKLDEDVQVVATPGHTLSSVSVIVNNTNLGRIVGISGDLFECEDDIKDARIWCKAGYENFDLQLKNRLIMAKRCLYIIPGHGPGFEMTESKRVKLCKDQENLQEKT